MLFVVSAVSVSTAMIILLARRSGPNVSGLLALHRIDGWLIALEFLVLVATLVSLGAVLQAWLNAWGLLLFCVILLGAAAFALHWRRDWLGERNMTAAAVLVVTGGLLLRTLIGFTGGGA
jgi:hypothetical protein